jgi:hydrogenase maturation protease
MVQTEPASAPGFRRMATDVLVLGCGEVGRSDLAAGVLVAEELAEHIPGQVRILAGSIGPDVEPELDGATHILLIDCVDVGRAPGSVVLFDGESLSPCVALASIRDPQVAHLIFLAGQHADAPEEVALLGVQPALTDPGDGVSEPLEAALPRMVDLALAVLRSWLDPEAPAVTVPRVRPGDC